MFCCVGLVDVYGFFFDGYFMQLWVLNLFSSGCVLSGIVGICLMKICCWVLRVVVCFLFDDVLVQVFSVLVVIGLLKWLKLKLVLFLGEIQCGFMVEVQRLQVVLLFFSQWMIVENVLLLCGLVYLFQFGMLILILVLMDLVMFFVMSFCVVFQLFQLEGMDSVKEMGVLLGLISVLFFQVYLVVLSRLCVFLVLILYFLFWNLGWILFLRIDDSLVSDQMGLLVFLCVMLMQVLWLIIQVRVWWKVGLLNGFCCRFMNSVVEFVVGVVQNLLCLGLVLRNCFWICGMNVCVQLVLFCVRVVVSVVLLLQEMQCSLGMVRLLFQQLLCVLRVIDLVDQFDSMQGLVLMRLLFLMGFVVGLLRFFQMCFGMIGICSMCVWLMYFDLLKVSIIVLLLILVFWNLRLVVFSVGVEMSLQLYMMLLVVKGLLLFQVIFLWGMIVRMVQLLFYLMFLVSQGVMLWLLVWLMSLSVLKIILLQLYFEVDELLMQGLFDLVVIVLLGFVMVRVVDLVLLLELLFFFLVEYLVRVEMLSVVIVVMVIRDFLSFIVFFWYGFLCCVVGGWEFVDGCDLFIVEKVSCGEVIEQ